MRATIRSASADDPPKIAACVDAAYQHYIARIGTKPGPMRTNYAESIRHDQVHVAEQDGRLVGALVLAVTEEGFLLEMIAVHPSAQGSGVGRLLLEFSEAEARRQGYAEIYLYTHEKMTENQALYSKIGYAEYDRRMEQGLARVYMRKKLQAETGG
jgi:N-acetylglutamate synthase-like GNAT family acetyltransferase